MRNPDRLDIFYENLKNVHKNAVPDQRFGQFMCNFLGWVANVKKRDPFFPEENEMLTLLDEYVNSEYPFCISPFTPKPESEQN